MKLLLYGANQNSISQDDIQKYILSDEEAKKQLNDLKSLDGVDELIIYNNEWFTEYYFLVDETLFQHGDFLTYLSNSTEKEIDEVILDTYSKFNADLITHLLTVLVGIDFEMNSVAFLADAEKAVVESGEELENTFLNQLFIQAVQFISELRTLPELHDMFQSRTDLALQHILTCFRHLIFNRFYIAGSEEYIVALGKMLYRNGAQHITLSSTDKARDADIIQSLNDWAESLSSKPLKKNFYTPITKNAQLYYLSSADGIIIEQITEEPGSKEEWFYDQLNQLLKEIETIRHNKKKQCLFILNEENNEFSCDDMEQKIYNITPDTEVSLSIETQVEVAKDYFERQAELETEKLYTSYKIYSKEM